MSVASVTVPRGSPSCLLLLWEALQDQQVGLTQAPSQLLPLFWVAEQVRYYALPLRVESLFPMVFWSPKHKPH